VLVTLLQVLLPCLRPDMANLQPVNQSDSGRRYLTCCVRLSPEKEAERFVDVVEALQKLGALDKMQVGFRDVTGLSAKAGVCVRARGGGGGVTPKPPAPPERRFACSFAEMCGSRNASSRDFDPVYSVQTGFYECSTVKQTLRIRLERVVDAPVSSSSLCLPILKT